MIFLRSVRQLLVKASVVPSSLILVTLIKQVISFSEMSVRTTAIQRNIPEDVIPHSHRCENGWLKCVPYFFASQRFSKYVIAG
jgi:hypothetical protein